MTIREQINPGKEPFRFVHIKKEKHLQNNSKGVLFFSNDTGFRLTA